MDERYQLCTIIIIGMNVVDNLNSVQVINKPCVCTRTMRLSTFSALRRDLEHLLLFPMPKSTSEMLASNPAA